MLTKGGPGSPLEPPASGRLRRRARLGGIGLLCLLALAFWPHPARPAGWGVPAGVAEQRELRSGVTGGWGVPAGVAEQRELRSGVTGGGVDVVEIDGPIDAVQRDFLRDALARAEAERAEVLMLRVNSPGSLGVSSVEIMEMVRRSPVPVVVYVGPAGAAARGAGAFLAAAAGLAIVAPGAEIGPLLPDDLDGPPLTAGAARALLRRQASRPAVAEAYAGVRHRSVSGQAARRAGLVTFVAPTVGDAVVGLDGRSAVVAGGGVVPLETAEVRRVETGSGERPRRVPSVSVRFDKLTGARGFLHKINTPTYAYVLLVLGLVAIAFEFFAASVGIAGVVGAALALMSFQAMGTLPVRWWAVALICAGLVALCIDVALGNLAVPSVFGTACVLAGSIWFTASGVYRVHWYAVVLVGGGVVLFFAFAMTSVSRSRFSTPTIGREVLVGRHGVVRSALAPVGLVAVEGALWSARAHRGRIGEGELVTVRAVDGFVLDVDPGAHEGGEGPA